MRYPSYIVLTNVHHLLSEKFNKSTMPVAMTCLPLEYQARDQLRRVLQIGIDDHNGVALRLMQTGRHCDLLAEVAA